jgi:hypothetical protein
MFDEAQVHSPIASWPETARPRRLALTFLLLSLRPACCLPRCTYDVDQGAGYWGGSCTCPDGNRYWVGDENNGCGSLACHGGGVPGECNAWSDNKWANQRVNCQAPAPAPAPTESPTCHTTTVAYAFIIRDQLPFWDLWKRYFDTCPPGAVLPVVHTQASAKGRATLRAQLAPYGGKLVAEDDVRWGNPRWNFLGE